MTRTPLTADTNFYVAPTGVDGFDGTDPFNPCRTRQYLYDRMQRERDLCHYRVTVNHADGIYTDSFSPSGGMPGLDYFGQMTFRGNLAMPGSCVIKPSSGAALSVQNGARLFAEGFKFDMTDGASDCVIVTNESSVGLGKNVFGYNLMPYQDVQPGFRSTTFFYADYAIDKPAIADVGSLTAGSPMIGLGSPSGILPSMGIVGAGIPAGAYVQSIAGCWVTMGGGVASITTGSESLTFTSGGQAHVQADPGAWVGWTSTPAAPLTVTVSGSPCYRSAWLVNDAALFILDGVAWRGLGSAPSRLATNSGIFNPAS